MPKCSVVLAVRDEEEFLAEALNSILAQEGVDLEVIIVDDNSVDSTPQIATAFDASHANVHFLANTSQGKASAFNFGVASAAGDLVCLFAGDDVMPPGSLGRRIGAFDSVDPQQSAVLLAKIETMSDEPKHNGKLVPRAAGIGNPSGASVMMNRKAAERIFPVPSSLPSEDSWLSVAINYLPGLIVLHSDVVACRWRLHTGNTGGGNPQQDFRTFNARISRRMDALEVFHDLHGQELDDKRRQHLTAVMHCEKMRREGNIVGVLRSPIPFKSRTRALLVTRPILYRVRQALHPWLSGRG